MGFLPSKWFLIIYVVVLIIPLFTRVLHIPGGERGISEPSTLQKKKWGEIDCLLGEIGFRTHQQNGVLKKVGRTYQ